MIFSRMSLWLQQTASLNNKNHSAVHRAMKQLNLQRKKAGFVLLSVFILMSVCNALYFHCSCTLFGLCCSHTLYLPTNFLVFQAMCVQWRACSFPEGSLCIVMTAPCYSEVTEVLQFGWLPIYRFSWAFHLFHMLLYFCESRGGPQR